VSTLPKPRSPRRKKTKKAVPIVIGSLVSYVGAGKTLAKGAALRVVAEASGKRFIVEGIASDGAVIRRLVLAKNLIERMPDLFSDVPLDADAMPTAVRRRR
jgi:hypothetical protein